MADMKGTRTIFLGGFVYFSGATDLLAVLGTEMLVINRIFR